MILSYISLESSYISFNTLTCDNLDHTPARPTSNSQLCEDCVSADVVTADRSEDRERGPVGVWSVERHSITLTDNTTPSPSPRQHKS